MLPEQAIEYLKSMPADEPVFVLRGRDLYMPAALVAWATHVRAPVKSKSATEDRHRKADGAMQLAEEVRLWQKAHPEAIKIPD
jgi:hypothetical protein